jgi:hypothetical protein
MMKRILIFIPAVLGLSIGAAGAGDPPDMKEGLWSIHLKTTDNPGNSTGEATYTLCRSHAFDKVAREQARNVTGCTTTSESFVGGNYTTESRCVAGATVIASKGTTTFIGDTATHTESHSTKTPPRFGVSETPSFATRNTSAVARRVLSRGIKQLRTEE